MSGDINGDKLRHSERVGRRNIGPNQASANSISPTDKLLGRLDRVKSTGPGSWLASCPTSVHKHGDRSRGLSIREGDDGRVLLHCFAGCGVAEVVGAIGIEMADLYPPRPTEYPDRAPRGGITGRDRVKRIAWPDLFEAIESDLRACSLAFSDLAAGVPFTREDAAFIAKSAHHLADEISGVIHA